jgi:hypothetical protein
MLSEIADRVCVFAAFDFDLVPMGRVDTAFEAIYDRVKPTWMAASPVHYLLRLPERHCLLDLGVKRLSWSLLGLTHWMNHLEDYVNISKYAIEKLRVENIKRIGFKVLSFIPLNMNREEMSRLMFGTFLADRDSLVPVLDNPDDPFVQFHGKKGNLDYVLTLTAMSKADIINTIRNIPNFAHFREDKYPEDNLRSFHSIITSQECFYFDVDFSRTDRPPSDLNEFLPFSLKEAESLAKACVDYLQAKPLKQ